MRKIVVAAFVVAQFLVGGALAAEKRCGWVVNPTPGNWWLTDSQGDWVLAFQGGEPSPGMELLPDISAPPIHKCRTLNQCFKKLRQPLRKILGPDDLQME